jgi:hypothetical protein
MKLSINRLKEQIITIEQRIDNLKSKIQNSTEFQNEVNKIYENEAKSLEKSFIDADKKAKKVISRPFLAKKYNHTGTTNNKLKFNYNSTKPISEKKRDVSKSNVSKPDGPKKHTSHNNNRTPFKHQQDKHNQKHFEQRK